jgi:hypothetical protein
VSQIVAVNPMLHNGFRPRLRRIRVYPEFRSTRTKAATCLRRPQAASRRSRVEQPDCAMTVSAAHHALSRYFSKCPLTATTESSKFSSRHCRKLTARLFSKPYRASLARGGHK